MKKRLRFFPVALLIVLPILNIGLFNFTTAVIEQSDKDTAFGMFIIFIFVNLVALAIIGAISDKIKRIRYKSGM